MVQESFTSYNAKNKVVWRISSYVQQSGIHGKMMMMMSLLLLNVDLLQRLSLLLH